MSDQRGNDGPFRDASEAIAEREALERQSAAARQAAELIAAEKREREARELAREARANEPATRTLRDLALSIPVMVGVAVLLLAAVGLLVKAPVVGVLSLLALGVGWLASRRG